jgi:hypothetical protein
MTLRAEEFTERRETVGAWEINVRTYRLGDVYYCSVDNVSPGAVVARAEGPTREEAEEIAVRKARKRVEQTRVMPMSK